MSAVQVYFHGGDEPVPADRVVLYEAEWNEGADYEGHAEALRFFARRHSDAAVRAVNENLRAGADPAVGFVTLEEFGASPDADALAARRTGDGAL